MSNKKEVLFLREEYGEGRGKYIYPKGEKYVGEYNDGKQNGQGTMTFPDGGKYVGEWKNGKYHGQGTLTFGKGKWKGEKYEGEWKNGKISWSRNITLTLMEKSMKGNSRMGEYHGQGTYTWSDGRKYEGEFKDGERNGQGTYTFGKGKS